MPNSIDSGLKKETFLNTFLEAFVLALLPLNVFARDFNAGEVAMGDTIKVKYIPAASAAKDFNGTYTVQDSDWQKKEVTINKHKYVSVGLSDSDLASTSIITLEDQARQKAYSLAKGVLQDILSEVTAANFGSAVFTGGASGFDLDDVADIRTAVVKAGWPNGGRGLVLTADYYGNVVKDNNLQDVSAAGSDATRTTGVLPNLYSFRPYECEVIPANGENLVGFAALMSAMAIGMRYLKPLKPEKYLEARPLNHPETGITIGFREDYDTKTGVLAQFLECNYGYETLETAALKRLVSSG